MDHGHEFLTFSREECINVLATNNLLRPPNASENAVFCPGTWDTILCWPATLANYAASHRCPPFKTFDHNKRVVKECDWNGSWASKPGLGNPISGYTDYYKCLPQSIVSLSSENLERVQEIAQIVRYCEYCCLSISFCTLSVALIIFICQKRLRSFRNRLHVQLMASILLLTFVRFVLYVDGDISNILINSQSANDTVIHKETILGPTINTSRYVCEAFYALLEYAKCVAYSWMVCEGFHLFHSLVFSVFRGEPRLWPYALFAWGFPVIHVGSWILGMWLSYTDAEAEENKCFGTYYWETEYWILESVRLYELVMNTIFLVVIVIVLSAKVRGSAGSQESEQIKKSVKAAFMLIPLLGIPNLLQQLPILPTNKNITGWTVYTFVSTIAPAIQGFFISLLYCFTNREVEAQIKQAYVRFRWRHATFEEVRRGSRALSLSHGTGHVNHAAKNHDASTEDNPCSPMELEHRNDNNRLLKMGPSQRRFTSDHRTLQKGVMSSEFTDETLILHEQSVDKSGIAAASANNHKITTKIANDNRYPAENGQLLPAQTTNGTSDLMPNTSHNSNNFMNPDPNDLKQFPTNPNTEVSCRLSDNSNFKNTPLTVPLDKTPYPLETNVA